ncbi:hypothetical protein CDL12_16152 [Handroanthus impetiginosus]|uniref:Uncharacterized protein n=1 Tax=Handroanthus impetiginosus TaxID=429701 RepID=A0A2G9H167_9LAMI|nr:hypothetical protein CDL12_16152 [Handroanthus impetiginosus]
MAQSEINFETVWSEEQERVPLKQRLKLLLASHRIPVISGVHVEDRILDLPSNGGAGGEAVAEKRGNEQCDSQSGCSTEKSMTETISRPKKHAENAGQLGESDNQENLAYKCMNSRDTVAPAATAEKTSSVDSSLLPGSLCMKHPITVKVECADDGVATSSANCMDGSSLAGIHSVKVEPEMSDEFLDELDHIVLKERLTRLLTSKCLGMNSMMLEENSAGTGKGELRFRDPRHAEPGNQIHEINRTLKSGSSEGIVSSFKSPQLLGYWPRANRSTFANPSAIKKNNTVYSSDKKHLKYESDGGKTLVQGSAIPSLGNIKTEPPNYDEFQSFSVTIAGQMSLGNSFSAKSEVDIVVVEDELDHMLLRDRMKLLSSRQYPSLSINQSSDCMNKTFSSAFRRKQGVSKPAESLKVNRPRKRRKTVTDSVETAMEEDAPGLLQVLIEKGVSVNEIKLYVEPESNEALDDSSTNDNFTELEAVITKLFSQRESLLKLGPLRCTKGEKTSYCLECLFSLVEQARYLQFRNWPVEWGWCRDLQSFIFVFERHNRIVLERPEYGYATYFFELADSLPVDWQIKRLVTAMKLTSCSRITLIENKALMVLLYIESLPN